MKSPQLAKLLEMLELRGALVTMDAMGCQREIAKKIVNGGGDYSLAVKDNQPALRAAIESFFEDRHEQDDFSEYGCRRHQTTERSRGRVEERDYTISPVPQTMKSFCRAWKNLKSIGQVLTVTEHGDQQTSDVRYYISSRDPKVQEFTSSVRKHWSIESMHWILDVVFREDASRIRNGDGTENSAFVRKFVMGLLQRDTSRGSLKGKQKRAGWSTIFLEKLPFG